MTMPKIHIIWIFVPAYQNWHRLIKSLWKQNFSIGIDSFCRRFNMAAETTLGSLTNRLLDKDNIIQEQNDRRYK